MSNEYPKSGSSMSGTETAYSVEARYAGKEPKMYNGKILGEKWTRLTFVQSPIGVPDGPRYYWASRACGLYGYSAAQALRWWFHAQADAEILGGLCLETRIIKHEVKHSFSESAISDHDHIGGEDRSADIPDWGKKK